MHDKNPNIESLNMIYQNSKTAIETIDCVLPKVKNIELKKDLASQLIGHHNLVKGASNQLYDANHYPQDVNFINKIPAVISANLKSSVDNSESHIAEMMIQNSTSGLIDIQKNFNKNKNLTQEVMDIGNEAMQFEQRNINKLRNYL